MHQIWTIKLTPMRKEKNNNRNAVCQFLCSPTDFTDFICMVTQVDFWWSVKKGLKSTWSDKMALSTKMRIVKKHELESIICTDVKWEQRVIGETQIGKKVPQTALKWFQKTPSTTDTSVKNCGCNNGNKIYGCISKWIWSHFEVSLLWLFCIFMVWCWEKNSLIETKILINRPWVQITIHPKLHFYTDF